MSHRRVFLFAVLTIGAVHFIKPGVAADGSKIQALPAPVAERARWIEEARRENPELFAEVARCYELVFSPSGEILGREYPYLKGFTLEVLHPDYRAAMQAHPDVYSAIKAAHDRALERVDEARRQCARCPVPPSIWSDYRGEVQRIFDNSNLPQETLRLIAGAVNPPPLVRLDPATLPAWEAALLDPDVPWVAKGLVGRIVTRFEEPGSTPVLGWFLRDAGRALKDCRENGPVGPGYLRPQEMRMRQGAGPPLDPCEEPLNAGSIVAGEFEFRPREDIAMELAGVLQDAGDAASIRRWGERLKSSSRWMQLLEELAKNLDKAARLEPLLTEVGLGKEKRRDSE
jgi:hypothetical protein